MKCNLCTPSPRQDGEGTGTVWEHARDGTGTGQGWDRYGMGRHRWISCRWHTTPLTAVPGFLFSQP